MRAGTIELLSRRIELLRKEFDQRFNYDLSQESRANSTRQFEALEFRYTEHFQLEVDFLGDLADFSVKRIYRRANSP